MNLSKINLTSKLLQFDINIGSADVRTIKMGCVQMISPNFLGGRDIRHTADVDTIKSI